MKKAPRLLIITIVAALPSVAQQKLVVDAQTMCSWNEDSISTDSLYRFPPDKETQGAVDKIMRFTGLQVNFELVAANVPTAVATIQNGKRLILYNQLFMKDVNKDTGTNWAAISILAHEIGHHLNQHTLGLGGDRSEQELAADKFSGDILFKMGASLEQARAAMQSRPETKSPYYPKKEIRLIAIGNGWINAQENANSVAPIKGQDKQTPTITTNDNADNKQIEDPKAEERKRKAEEKERKAQEKADREQERRERLASSRGCYAWGRRFCSLPNDGPVGASCWCAGVAGTGISGIP